MMGVEWQILLKMFMSLLPPIQFRIITADILFLLILVTATGVIERYKNLNHSRIEDR